MSPDTLLACCGLYCGACSFKVAFDTNDRAHLRGMPAKYREYEDAPLQFCPGCRLDNQCGACGIRDCVLKQGLLHCGECPEFPCNRIQTFNDDGIPHHAEAIPNLKRLEEIGAERWLAEQAARWQCGCGGRRSWYLPACPGCGKQSGD